MYLHKMQSSKLQRQQLVGEKKPCVTYQTSPTVFNATEKTLSTQTECSNDNITTQRVVITWSRPSQTRLLLMGLLYSKYGLMDYG